MHSVPCEPNGPLVPLAVPQCPLCRQGIDGIVDISLVHVSAKLKRRLNEVAADL